MKRSPFTRRPRPLGREQHVAILLTCFMTLLSLLASEAKAQEEPPSLRDKVVIATFPSEGMGTLFKRILKEAYANIGYSVEFRKVPANRGLVLADTGEVDGEAARVPVIEKNNPNLMRVPTSLYLNRVVAFSRTTEFDPKEGWAGVAHHHVGSVSGYKFIETKTRHMHRTLCTSYNQLFSMLSMGRIDLAISEYLEALPTLHNVTLGQIWALDPPLATKPMYHYLHKKNADLLPLINKSLRAMKESGRMADIQAQLEAEFSTGQFNTRK